MNLFVTTAEIKLFLGIAAGDTSKDSLIAMFNKMATDVVNGALSLSDASLHLVTDEVQKSDGQYLNLYDTPIVAIGKIMDGMVEYTQEYEIMLGRVRLQKWLNAGSMIPDFYNFRTTKITYAAGYAAYAYAKISITDLANLAANATITLGSITPATDGYTLTRGVNWNAGVSSEDEAAKIAAAIQAKDSTSAFALGSDVYVIEKTNPQVTGRTITTSDSTRLALSASALGGINIPESIRLAIMIYVANLLNSRKNPRMKSYSIGNKTVSFASDAEFQQFNDLLQPLKKVGVKAV